MIVAQGQLTDRPLPRTFAAIATRGFGGQLVIDPGGREHRLAWHGGAIVAATSPHPADSAAKIAVTIGVLSSTQAGEAARAIAANPGCDEVEVVARIARLPSEAVGRMARRLVAARAARVFALETGPFVLDDTPELAAVPPIDARWILYSGVRAHYTLDRLRRELATWANAIRLVDGADLTAFGFGQAEADAVARLTAGPLTLSPVPMGLDAAVVEAMAIALLATGAAVPDASTAAAARIPAPAPPLVAPPVPPAAKASPEAPARPSGVMPTVAAPARQTGVIPTVAAPARQTGVIPTVAAPARQTGVIPTVAAPARQTGVIPTVAAPARQTGVIPTVAAPARQTGVIPTVAGATTPPPRPAVSRTRTVDPTRVAALIAHKRALVDGGADHFELLEVDADAPVEAIRAAYFELARYLHPDRLAAAGLTDDRREAHRVFARINEAFAVLSDPARRADYLRVQAAGGAAALAAAAEQAATQVRQVLGGEEAYRRGEGALRRMQLDEALAYFEQAVELSPTEADHHAMLGWTTYVAAPDKAAALPLARSRLRRATELSEKSALGHLLLGRIARMEQDPDTAIKHLRRALEIAPRSTDAAAELRAAESLKARPARASSSLFSKLKKS
ncbi:MAG: DnaJ domain-containing protein [Kofleriaceae bacterium]|nr:DnaJ domain-containing protein [Kofleriaceae bacterium]MBP9167316.1 DnaJ domain-containing protein [Kofleriaceae bacterium]MBP9859865.1 DnaJ domain-containing protein [Kofleriaceae bacterium]